MSDLIRATRQGLYCATGDFYIDPWRPVEHAVITHGHADHARPGSEHYYTIHSGSAILRKRLGQKIRLRELAYGETLAFNNVTVSLHPAGHILGSAQVRIEHDNEVWVVSGDYKRDPDLTCEPFEVVPCDTFITEATFALPVYQWQSPTDVVADILAWWQDNAAQGKPSVLFCYALGKAQRVLAELHRLTSDPGPIILHGALAPLVEIYRQAGIALPPTSRVSESHKSDYDQALIMAPPSAAGSTWMKRFRGAATGFCSGWMRIRGNRRRRGYDRGFVISDHADWHGLINTIRETGATQVLTTHGRGNDLAHYLEDIGIHASTLQTEYGDTNAETEYEQTTEDHGERA